MPMIPIDLIVIEIRSPQRFCYACYNQGVTVGRHHLGTSAVLAKALSRVQRATLGAVALATALLIYSAASARADPGLGLTDQVTSASETLVQSTAALTDIASTDQVTDWTAADLPVSTSITSLPSTRRRHRNPRPEIRLSALRAVPSPRRGYK